MPRLVRMRLRQPTIAVDDNSHAILMPAGEVIVLEAHVLDMLTEGLASVQWRGKAVRMFGIDIRERGEQIESADA